MPPPKALLDANVLYPASLRDPFLRLPDGRLYAPLWSAAIHEEWMRSLLADRSDIEAGVLDKTRAVMDDHFPDAVVKGYEAIIATFDLLDPGDRHVLAAAILGGVDIIVTRNLRDFPAPGDPWACRAASRRLYRRAVRGRHRCRAGRRSRPPRGAVRPAGAYLAALEGLGLGRTVSLLRQRDTAI